MLCLQLPMQFYCRGALLSTAEQGGICGDGDTATDEYRTSTNKYIPIAILC